MTLADEDTISNYIGAGLTQIAPDGRIVPWLAERWSFSPNGKTLTFHLKPGITFHSGRPMTAADIKATFERDIDPATASPYDRDFLSSVASFVAPDASTLVLTLKAARRRPASDAGDLGIPAADGPERDREVRQRVRAAPVERGAVHAERVSCRGSR